MNLCLCSRAGGKNLTPCVLGMLLKKNGYVLEQVFSPLVLRGGDDHDRLKAIAKRCITKNHAHHYLGFARG